MRKASWAPARAVAVAGRAVRLRGLDGCSECPACKESFGNAFKDACIKAGIPDKSAHGCPKIAATRAAENGATVAQLNAIFGWRSTAMASLYTEAAERKRLAREAMSKLVARNETATSIPAPELPVRGPGRKVK